MSTLLPALLGLAGTVLGAALALWTARLTASKTADAARDETRRDDFRAAVLHFASQMLSYRLAEVKLWRARFGQTEMQDALDERNSSRTTAWHSFYELQLCTNDKLVAMATIAMDTATAISQQNSHDDMIRLQGVLRQNVYDLVSAARADLAGKLPEIMADPLDEVAG